MILSPAMVAPGSGHNAIRDRICETTDHVEFGGSNHTATTLISAAPAGATWDGCSKAVDSCTPYELVKTFADRVFAIAKHITQNDDDAEDVLIDTFLEVCEDSDGCREAEKLWLRFVTIAVKEAFSKLRRRAEGGPLLGRASDSCE